MMWITRLKIARVKVAAVIVLAVGVAGVGPELVASQAQVEEAQKQPQGPSHDGVLKSIDAARKTLTVTIMIQPESKQTEDMTFAIAEDAKVFLEDRLSKDHCR